MPVGVLDKNMTTWEYRKRRIKKFINIFLVLGAMTYGLFIFTSVEGVLSNFKPSYASKVYLPSWSISLKKNNGIVSPLPADINVLGVKTSRALSVPVLLYHGVVEKPDGENVTVDQFRRQMFALYEAGYKTVSVKDFYEFNQGKKELPKKSFLLTFDDGRKDSYYPVDPILKALDYKAVMFVITKYSLSKEEHNYYLSKNELQKMIKSGRWEIQAHAREGHDMAFKVAQDGMGGHYYSNKLWLDKQNRLETDEEYIQRIKVDVISAKEDIETGLGVEVISFAYPFGDYGQSSINFPESESMVHDIVTSIYPMSFYQVWAGQTFSLNYPEEESSLIKRVEVKPNWNPNDLLKILEIIKDKTLPHEDNFSDYTGWVKKWGRISLTSNSIILSSQPSTNGGSIFLEGSYLWEDYIFKSNVKLQKGQTFSLLSRYKDDKNYVSCVFSPEFIRVEQMANGKRKLALVEKGNNKLIGKNKKVGIEVYDNNVACYVDGKAVIRGDNVNNILEHGGIGFQTWDPQINNSEIIIKGVVVEEIK